MMNITEAYNFIDRKSGYTPNSKGSGASNNEAFSSILNKEKKGLLSDKQKDAKNIINNNQNKTKGFTKQINNSNNITDKSYNEPRSNVIDNKASTNEAKNETKQVKKYQDENIDEITENLEEDMDSSHGILLVQSILLAVLENIEALEDTDYDGNIEINVEQFDDLREQLLSLLEIIDTTEDDSFKQNIENIVVLLKDMTDEKTLDPKLIDIKELKDNIQSVLNNFNPSRLSNIQNIQIKDDFVNAEESLKEKEETLINVDDTDKKAEKEAKVLDKSILEDDEEQVLNQPIKDKEVLFKEQLIRPDQHTKEQVINLKVVNEQIVEPRQFISEIAQKASTLILKDKNEMNIQLIPENLGKISIKIGLNEGTLTGKIYAENYSVKEIIESNLNQLRDSLEEQGLNIGGLEVHINDNPHSFNRNLNQPTFTNRQKSKINSIESNINSIDLEESAEQINPYLTINRFEGLV